MAQEVDDLIVQAQANSDVEAAAVGVLNGFAAKLDAAIAAALAAGATPAVLAAISGVNSSLKASATDLAAAIASQPA